MLASLERHLGGICEMCRLVSDKLLVWICALSPLDPVEVRGVLGSERLTLPLVKCETCADVLYWHTSPFCGLDYAQTLVKRRTVFPKIQGILEYLTPIWMPNANYHQVLLDPLGKGPGAFRMRVLQSVFSWGLVKWGHPKSLGSAEILVLLKSWFFS